MGILTSHRFASLVDGFTQCFILLVLTRGGDTLPLLSVHLSSLSSIPSPLELGPFPSLPVKVGPSIAVEGSGGAQKVPQLARPEPDCQTYFGAFRFAPF